MKQFLLNICLTAIALCLFKMLIPENSMKKQADFLIACFFLASVFFFATSGGIDITGITEAVAEGAAPYVDFSESFSEEQKRAVAEAARDKVKEVLAREEMEADEIYVIVNILGMYNISINEIRLVFRNDNGENLERAVLAVQKEVGDEITVTGEIR